MERDPDAEMGYGIHFFCVSLMNQDVATSDVVGKWLAEYKYVRG